VPEARQIRGIYWKEVEGLASSSLQRRPSAFEAEMEGRACKSALEAKGELESCRVERLTIPSLRLYRCARRRWRDDLPYLLRSKQLYSTLRARS
jgi:hypothetical protein